MSTIYSTADIYLESPTYNIDVIPEQLKNTHRALLKYAHALYVCDIDLTFTVYYKPLYSNTEYSYAFTMSKNNVYFKQKLPNGKVAREWRYTIQGLGATTCDIDEAGLLWLPVPIGGR